MLIVDNMCGKVAANDIWEPNSLWLDKLSID